MKVNLYKSEVPDHLLLRVEGIEQDISEAIKIFLCMIPIIKTESVVIEGENMARFAIMDLTPEQLKNLKISIINTIRGMLELDPNQMTAAYLLEKQRSESSVLMVAELEKSNLDYFTQNEIFKEYIKRIHMVLGWMAITTAAAILVAVVAIISRWVL